MNSQKRDRAIEEWLNRPRGTSRREHAEPCPDEETIAAWVDGALSGDALERVLTHASTCDRCDATVAALIRTESVRPALEATASAPIPLWRGWLTWGVPVAAAATAVVALAVWIRTPTPASQSFPAPTTAAARATAATPVPETTNSNAAVAGGGPGAETARTEALPEAEQRRSVAERAPEAPQATAETQTARDRSGDQRVSSLQPSVQGPKENTETGATQPRLGALQNEPAADAARKAVSEPAGQTDQRLSPVGAVAAAPPAAPAVPSPARSAARQSSAEAAAASAPAVGAAAASTAPAVIGGVAGRNSESSGSWTFLTSPDNRPAWRYRDRVVEHSSDGGSSWTRVGDAVPEILRAGSAVSNTVSWFVGGKGTVILVANGRWRLVPFPDPADLIAVTASGNASVSVTTIAGRVFRTADGGGTWRAE